MGVELLVSELLLADEPSSDDADDEDVAGEVGIEYSVLSVTIILLSPSPMNL